MNVREIKEAIEGIKKRCDAKMPKYEMCSARSVLYELGYNNKDTEQVLTWIYDSGFTYCLDHHFKCTSGLGDGRMEYPVSDVCFWGPDQLKSRLECVQ